MTPLLIYLTLLGVATAATFVIALGGIARIVGGAAWRLLASWLLVAAGTAPLAALVILWHARTADYEWAIQGPGIFAQLGGGPAMAAATVLVTVWAATTWTAAFWIVGRGLRRRFDG